MHIQFKRTFRKLETYKRLVWLRKWQKFWICTFIFALVLFYLVRWNIICFNANIEMDLRSLCLDHKLGKVYGKLCQPLCGEQSARIVACQTKHKGKILVFKAKWNNSLVVIKSSKVKSDYIPLQWMVNGKEIFPSPKEFQEMMLHSLNINLGIKKDNILPNLFPFVDDFSVIDSNLMINLWQLAQDNEYVLSMVYQDLQIFPRMLGTCGNFYAVEYAKPIPELVTFNNNFTDWISRVKYAKLFLELLDVLSTSFEDPIHICDVKMEHFGILNDKVVILDSDTVFHKSIVDRSTSDGRSCTRHEDCDLFDCHSLCNKLIQRCDAPVVNNNLQQICQKVFVDSFLLDSFYLSMNKRKLIEECANPYSSHGRRAAPLDFQRELLSYFNKILQVPH